MGGIRSAKKFGNACLQIGTTFGPGTNNTYDAAIGTSLGKPVGSEDCLYINIWRPATADKNLPVLLFLHGGSNVSGYTADPMLDGAALAKAAGVVVITASYRLGVLGFINLPQLRLGGAEGAAGEDSGNFALLDNMAALHFIRDNVANFGGDPGNVTLSGQSAGAVNLLALMAAPRAKGLFHKVFEMSGSISLPENYTGTISSVLPPSLAGLTLLGDPPLSSLGLTVLSSAEASLKKDESILKVLLGADGTSFDAASAPIGVRTPAQIAEHLRSMDGAALLTAVNNAKLGGAGPILDNTLLPPDLIGAIAADKYQKVPVLAGTTRDEGKLFASQLATIGLNLKDPWKVKGAQRFSMMFDFDPDAAPRLTVKDIIHGDYLPVGKKRGYNEATNLMTKLGFELSRDHLLDTLRKRQPPGDGPGVWSFRFDWAQEPPPWNDVFGAAHAFELPFVFGNFQGTGLSNVMGGKANEQGRLALSKAVMASVGAFMRSGNPNTPELGATWEQWPSQMLFDATLTAQKTTPVYAP